MAIKIILAATSTRDITRSVYKGRWESFVSWCSKRSENSSHTSLKHLDFLQTKSETLAVNTIKGYVTAILCRNAMVHDSPLSLDPMLKRWIKSHEHSKGIPHMITHVELVLAALTKAPFEPIATCLLTYLTWKTAFLFTVTSTHRASEMHVLSCKASYLRFSNAGVMLFTRLSFLPKVTTKTNTSRPTFVLVMHNQMDRALRRLCQTRSE